MKNILVFILLSMVSAPVFASTTGDELIGSWRIEPFLVEQEDGLLVSPDAAYAYPYTGLDGITFLDTGFVVFTAEDREYRAFYEIESLDFDNYYINCLFKSGEEFLLKLVKTGTDWNILYRIGEDSVLRRADPDEGMEDGTDDAVSEPESMMTEPVDFEAEASAEAVVESLYVGRLIKNEG